MNNNQQITLQLLALNDRIEEQEEKVAIEQKELNKMVLQRNTLLLTLVIGKRDNDNE